MKKVDFGLVVAILIVLPLGIYKLLYNTQNLYSVFFGVFLILTSAYLAFDLLKTYRKRT